MINILMTLGLLTINLEVLPIGEYQPLLLLAMGIYLALSTGRIGKPHFIASLIVMAVAVVSFIASQTEGGIDLIRVTIACMFLMTGSLIFQFLSKKVFVYVAVAHMTVLVIGLISPGVIRSVLMVFFPRGPLYYDGYNAFFASEPSYAAINYFGTYLLYRLAGEMHGWSRPSISFQMMFVLPLLFTKAITGAVFALIILLIMVYDNRAKIFEKKLALVPLFLSLIAAVFLFSDVDQLVDLGVLGFSRIGSFGAFLSDIDGESGLVLWSVLEPASSSRFVANFAGLIEGLSSFLGKGKLYIAGPDVFPYPSWLDEMFRANEIVAPGINSQTALFNFISISGWLSLLPIIFIFYYSWRGLKNLNDRGTMILAFSYIFIGMLWQGAFVAPILWIVLAVLMSRAANHGRSLSKEFNSDLAS